MLESFHRRRDRLVYGDWYIHFASTVFINRSFWQSPQPLFRQVANIPARVIHKAKQTRKSLIPGTRAGNQEQNRRQDLSVHKPFL